MSGRLGYATDSATATMIASEAVPAATRPMVHSTKRSRARFQPVRPEPGKREGVPDEGSEGIRFPRSVPVPHYKNGGARAGLASQTQKSSVGLIGYLGLTSMAGSLVGFWQRLVGGKRKNPLRDKDVTASI